MNETYEILGIIGQGGGGTVYKAYHKRLQKPVVLKEIRHPLSEINSRNETDILKNLRSKHLPQVLDFLTYDGRVYTVMDYIEGRSLEELLKTPGFSCGESQVIRWFTQLAETLTELHGKKPPIIHGDIKPANIMLQEDGNIVLIDFNISSIFDGKYTALTGYTPAYAAPEQIDYYHRASKRDADTGVRREARDEMQSAIDPRTDIYSLGATMYHVMTGIKPEGGKAAKNIREVIPGILEPLASIVDRCMMFLKEERFQSAEELTAALKNIYTSSQMYRGLLRRQRGLRIFFVLTMLASFGVMAVGLRMTHRERDAAYLSYVEEEITSAGAKDREGLDAAFEQAVALFPGRGEAYVEKGRYETENGHYEKGLKFLLETAIPYVTEPVSLSNLYVLTGMCYSGLQEYDDAHGMFQKALSVYPENGSAAREDAVCLARKGDHKGAMKALEQAERLGEDPASLAYTRGELYAGEEDFEAAEEAFRQAAEETEDAYCKLRAYLGLDTALRKRPGMDSINERIRQMTEAKEQVDPSYRSAVLERLAQALIDRYDETSDRMDADAAIETLEEIRREGMGSFDTLYSIAVLYHKLEAYEDEEAVLSALTEQYDGDYRISMQRAFLEAQREQKKPKEERDYTAFEAAYEQAEQEYERARSENRQDQNMAVLERLRSDLSEGGWLE